VQGQSKRLPHGVITFALPAQNELTPEPKMLSGVRKKYSTECLNQFDLNKGDIRFLSTRGVKDLPEFTVFFYNDCEQFEQVGFEGANYVAIGKGEYGERYCIHEKTREVYRLDLSPGGIKQYFNANIICLDLSFSALEEYLKASFSGSEDHLPDTLLEKFKIDLMKIDPKSLQEENSLWKILLSEWEAGL
jgi:hypothetical protein